MTTDATIRRLHNLATFLINYRYGIVALFVLITIGMMGAMSQLKIETGFKKQLPLKHEYMQTRWSPGTATCSRRNSLNDSRR